MSSPDAIRSTHPALGLNLAGLKAPVFSAFQAPTETASRSAAGHMGGDPGPLLPAAATTVTPLAFSTSTALSSTSGGLLSSVAAPKETFSAFTPASANRAILVATFHDEVARSF